MSVLGKLTIRQERFAQEVLRTGNQAEAYRIVYPQSMKWKDESVWQKASKLMVKVGPRVAELQSEAAKANAITVQRVLAEYTKLAFTDLPGIIDFRGGSMTIEDFASLTPDQRACIQTFEVKTEREMRFDDETGKMAPVPVQYVKVRLYSKQAALDKLAEFMGLGKTTKLAIDGTVIEGDEGSDDDAPVYIGFQQNVQINVQQ